MVAATASWPSRHTVARTGTTSPTTALAGYLPPETTGSTSSIPIRPTTTHPVRLARCGGAWCCTADRSGRALLSGLVYSLIAPYPHRSVHAIPTGSKVIAPIAPGWPDDRAVASRLGTFGGTVSGIGGSRCSTATPRRWSCWVRWGCDAIGPCGNEVAGNVVNAPFRRHLSAPTR